LTQAAKLDLQNLTEQFERDGYLILEKFFDENTCNQAIKESEDYISQQKIDKTKIARAMNMHQHSPTIKAMFNNKELWDVTKNFLKAEPFFLQTIYFHKGSEQALHSDYVYMSTIPEMQLCGLWIALEDTSEENGALMYVPGSHKIPITNIEETYKVEMPKIKKILQTEKVKYEEQYKGRRQLTGESLETCIFFDQWYDRIYKMRDEKGLSTKTMYAKKGDVLFWHGNLLHGGSPIKNKNASRKSFVVHFLTKDVVKYFDMNYVDLQNYMTLDSIDPNRDTTIQVQ